MMLLQAEFDSLVDIFNSLPSTLPESPPSSKLPPHIEIEFAEDEGPWAAFNKAMHAAFGDKAQGLKSEERGEGVNGAVKVIRWCLRALERRNDQDSVPLVKLWMDALSDAAKLTIVAHVQKDQSMLSLYICFVWHTNFPCNFRCAYRAVYHCQMFRT